MLELLSPVRDFECLKAAVQNGADSVYFGSTLFNARAYAHNFDLDELQKAIAYAKIRGVKTNLTLNTLIKDNEFNDALLLATKAYQYGIDAIIVQDLGLAKKLMSLFPDLPIHSSTQMTIHNLSGALEAESLGFKRIILARELTMDEIKYITKNTNVEIECFVHGALCISYSGQCLFSSMLGGRSGNRGKCAQPCRLPFELLEDDKVIDSGHLLSTRDLCGLDYIPDFLEAGVSCLKIEGRMKSPEYVATVTRIYRKYIDLASSNKKYIVDKEDRKTLMQAFNRGMSSSGHLEKEANRNLVFKEKPNNMGLFLGIVEKYNEKKGLITLKLKEKIQIGDTISLENESGSYTVSELMDKNENITNTNIGQIVTIGRMKGKINPGNKVYKLSSKTLIQDARESYRKENRKIPLKCVVTIKKSQPIEMNITSYDNSGIYKDLSVSCSLDIIPQEAKNKPLQKETIAQQIGKTASTPYEFKQIKIDLDENLFLPKLSMLNELRRTALDNVTSYVLAKIHRNLPNNFNISNSSDNNKTIDNMRNFVKSQKSLTNSNIPKISVLLNILHSNWDYSKLDGIDNVYIPLKYFTNRKYESALKAISKKFDTFIYMPTIIKGNYQNLLLVHSENALSNYNIKGFVVSNIGNISLLHDLFEDLDEYFKIIANYTFNVFNSQTVLELKKLGLSKFTLSPELDRETISNLCEFGYLQKELLVYGKVPLLNMNYCLLGQADKCYPSCSSKCNSNHNYYLKDRMNMKFKIMPDNIQTVTTIYNSKTTSISAKEFPIDFARIDILQESIEDINNIVNVVRSGKRFEGKDFTNGNLNREI